MIDRHITFLHMQMHESVALDGEGVHHFLFFEKLKKVDSADFFLLFVKLLNIFGSQLTFLKRNVIESRHAHTQVHLNS